MKFLQNKILYFDNHIVIAFKEAGVLSQGDRTGDSSILDYVKDFVKKEFQKKGDVFLGSVHRLDRPAMGIMLFAKTSKALSRLNEQFRKREIIKEYLAIISGKPEKKRDTLIHYLIKDSYTNRVKAYRNEKSSGKKAMLEYDTVSSRGDHSLLRIKLHTGRAHQIRVQLASIGHPIVGDLKYGSEYKTDGRSICLLSHKLTFVHPVKKEEMSFSARIPREKKYWDLFVDKCE